MKDIEIESNNEVDGFPSIVHVKDGINNKKDEK